MKRRIIALLLSLAICASLFAGVTVSAAGYTPKYTAAAETLYEFGLFKGVGKDASGNPNFALEQKATRLQGLVMLLRLLGKEEAALAYTGSNPFTDVPDWGKPYVGYAYENKLTKGTSATTFTPDGELLGKAYLTFVLRALGYDDAAGDFTYNDALTKAKELSLITGDAYNGAIYRDDCAYVSLKALTTVMKGGEQTLAEKLVKDSVLPKAALEDGVLTDGLKPEMQTSSTPDPADQQNTGTITGTASVSYNKTERTFTNGDVVSAIPDAAVIGVKVFPAAYKRDDFSLEEILLTNSWIGSYCSGEITQSGPIALNASDRPFNANKVQQLYGNRYVTKYEYAIHFSIITVLDKDFNLIAYSIVPPAYSGDTLAFTTCVYNGRDKIDAIRNKMASFDRTTTKLEKNLFYCEKDGDLGYLRFDQEKVSKKIGEVAYFAMGGKDSSYYRVVNNIGSAWAIIECDIRRDADCPNLYSVDTGCDYRIFTWNDALLFLYNKDKEIIGYVDGSGGFEVKEE